MAEFFFPTPPQFLLFKFSNTIYSTLNDAIKIMHAYINTTCPAQIKSSHGYIDRKIKKITAIRRLE